MKRILALAFILQLLLTSVCMAFEKPDENRWFYLGELGNKIEYWCDRETITFKKPEEIAYYPHQKHKIVELWIMGHELNEAKCMKTLWVIDISCNSLAIKSCVDYNVDGSVGASFTNSILDFRPVVPGTVGEFFLALGKDGWKNDSRNDLR